MEKIRKPIVAGQFYPADKTDLIKEIQKYTEKRKADEDIAAAIVPHAGYGFSGKAAGKVYSVLPKTETFIVIGTNHSTMGESISISLQDFETPLGIIKNNLKFSKQLLQQLNYLGIEIDNETHKYEHSIEVQLPFLQQTQKNSDFKIVPILIGYYDLDLCKKLAKAIYEISEKLKTKIVILASSDFTHSGPAYGKKIDKNMDKKTIEKIKKLDSEKFLQESKQTTICGAGAICVVLEFCKLKNSKKIKVLDYYTSQDIIPSENWVGYAGIIFLKK